MAITSRGMPQENVNPVEPYPSQDPSPRMRPGDNNRAPTGMPQTVTKYFQHVQEIPNHPDFPGYRYEPTLSVPFNIDESGRVGGSHL